MDSHAAANDAVVYTAGSLMRMLEPIITLAPGIREVHIASLVFQLTVYELT